MARVAVIGIDAAEWGLLERLMGEGEMPNLARLAERGATCTLRSESTWRSGRVWETLLTGVADFPSAALFEPESYSSWLVGARRRRPFYLDVPNARVLALDVPYMSLSYEVPGAQVVWGGHDAGYPRASRPAGLLTEIDREVGVHPAFHNDFTCGWYHPASIETLTDALLVGARRRVDVVRSLQRRYPDWSLFMTVLSEVHSAGEFFWHGVDPEHPLANSHTAALARDRLMAVHRAVDDSLGRIVEGLPADTNVVVCSLHGMQCNDYDLPSMVLLPELLHRAHFGRSLLVAPSFERWRRAGFPPVVPDDLAQKWWVWLLRRFDPPSVERLALALQDRMPRPARAALDRLGRLRFADGRRPAEELSTPILPESDRSANDIGEPRQPLDWQIPCWYRSYWPRMRAFALPVFYDARVRINLRGREREGRVERDQYEATCVWVEELLRACRDPRTGRSVVVDVERMREADPMDPDGPDADLLIKWAPAVDAFEHPELGVIGPVPHRRTGGHTDNGFALFCGSEIPAGALGERDAMDLTPTLVRFLGADPDARFEGESIF